MVSFSLFATWFGAETCIGSSAAVYTNGLSGSRADPFGFSICLLLMGLLLAARLRRGNYVTLADYFRERYGPLVENLAIWVMIPSSLIWGAAQIRAFGQIVASTTNLPVGPAITVAAAFVLVYTLMAGLLGDIYTDLIQGFFIAVGLGVLLYVSLQHLSGLSEFLAGINPSRLSFIGPSESIWQRIDRWTIPILGSLVTQEAISRLLAARSVSIARKASFVACGIYLALASIPVFLGLFGPFFLPGIDDPEQYLIRLAGAFLPKVLFILFSGALISAIISTIDSILLAVSALISHNLLVPVLKLKSDRARVLSARIVVLVSGVAAYLIALYSKGIYNLVLTASSFGTAGILVITLAGLFTKWGGPPAAIASMVAGFVLTPLNMYVFDLQAPFLTSILGAGLAFCGGAAVVWTKEGLRLKLPFLTKSQ